MNSERTTALLTGVLFIVTFVTAIPAVFLYDPALNDTGYVIGAGWDWRVLMGAFLELLLILAIVLFPIDVALRRLVFRLEDVPAWQAALQPQRAARARPIPAEATVTRLRERVEGIRAARVAEPRSAKKPPEDPTGELLARRRRP